MRRAALALLLLAAPAAARPDPRLEEAALGHSARFTAETPRRRRDREIDVLKLSVILTPDLEKQSFEASLTQRFKVLASTLTSLSLDAALLDIRHVADERGKALKFEAAEEKLEVTFAPPLKEGQETSIRIDYASTQSQMGLHFFKADPRYPGQPDLVWSKGETERARYWLPLYDYPNERAATEMTARVPEGFLAVSNGVLAERRREKDGRVAFRWVQDRPHASYLITLAVGRFEPVVLASTPVPVTVWAPPGRAEEARRAFGRTVSMLRFFTGLTGVPYPWAKFDQVLLYGFRWGGMEDTSAVMLSDRALLDERAALDEDHEGLISHELAHQWFGDLVTVKDWSQMWLSEGFADYYAALWTRQVKGQDEFAYELQRGADWYLAEAAAYRRPLVSDRYQESDNMFDAHSYAKGAWVLQRLRFELGDLDFWRSVGLYLERKKDDVAETEDLRQAVEDTTGKPMQDFFRQWTSTPGHPELLASARWTPATRAFTLSLSQKQDEPFRFTLPVEVVSGSVTLKALLPLSRKEEVFSWRLAARPTGLRIDPSGTTLAAHQWDLPVDWLWALVKDDPSVFIRLRALAALPRRRGPADVRRLRDCVLKDPFWGVAGACAARLGAIGSPGALEALAAGRSVPHPKTRRAVAQALGRFLKDAGALEALKGLTRDPSYFVEAAALQSLGALRLAEARPLLESRLNEDSHNDVIRKAALAGLGGLMDPAVLPTLRSWAEPGRPVSARLSALSALASAGAGRTDVLDYLTRTLKTDEDRMIRQACALALGALGDSGALEALAALSARESDPRIRIRALDQTASELAGRRKTKLERLSGRTDAFQERLQALQGKMERP